jgi:hypothetical protein
MGLLAAHYKANSGHDVKKALISAIFRARIVNCAHCDYIRCHVVLTSRQDEALLVATDSLSGAPDETENFPDVRFLRVRSRMCARGIFVT